MYGSMCAISRRSDIYQHFYDTKQKLSPPVAPVAVPAPAAAANDGAAAADNEATAAAAWVKHRSYVYQGRTRTSIRAR